MLPDGGTRFDLTRLDDFRSYTAQNAQSWCRWANAASGRTAGDKSLYLVTGADKASSWSVAFYRDALERSSLTLSSVASPSEHPYVWEGSAARGEMRTSSKHGQGPLESRRNQCVFLRGYRLELNEALLASAVASPSSLDTVMKTSETTMSPEHGTGAPPSISVRRRIWENVDAVNDREERKPESVHEVAFLLVELAMVLD